MKIKMLSADEEIAYYFFFVLNEIKKGINLQLDTNKPICYTVVLHPALNDPYKPNSTVEQQIIRKLIQEGVIKETKERSDCQIPDSKSNNPKYASFNYYLKINNSKFDIWYQKYKKFVTEYETAETIGNTLIFYTDGRVIYVSPQGKEYKTSFGTKTNSYKLLQFLTRTPFQPFSFKELATTLNKARSDFDLEDDERRVRDTVQAIKKKLGDNGDDLFIADYGFGLKCNVNLIK